MIEKLLKELQDTWGYPQEELDHMEELMEDFGLSCYEVGYTDGRRSAQEESRYYGGFLYAKKSDNE